MTKNNGFTLIEVLVSTVVLSIGLLGLAGLQAGNLKNNQSAYYRSQATQLAYDIADRMRANASASGNYLSANMAVAAATQQAACTTVGTACTPAKMAENDLYDLKSALASALPAGSASITAASGVFTVTINWDDNHDGSTNSSDPNFLMSFQL